MRSANPWTLKNIRYENRIFSEIDFQLQFLYREEVVQPALLTKIMGKFPNSDQALSQRLLYNIEMKKTEFAEKPASRI